MAIFSALPYTLVNGAVADATQVMADFNQIVANGNANCAKNGANSDITSLSGLLVPLSSSQGGTVIFDAATVGGTANAVTLDGLVPTMASHNIGNTIQFTPTATNTGAVTVTPTGLAAKAVVINGSSALIGGELQVGKRVAIQYDGTQYQIISYMWPTIMDGYLFGCTMSVNGGDAANGIDIAPGVAASQSGVKGMIVLLSTITKKVNSAWALGSGNGGLDTGAVANTTYHMYLIRRSDTGVVDALFSLSATSPTMPANYDQFRRVGAIVRIAAANKTFIQKGDTFLFNVPIQDYSTATTSNTAALVTLSVPIGISVFALTQFNLTCGATAEDVLWSCPDAADRDPVLATGNYTVAAIINGNAQNSGMIPTDTSGRLRVRSDIGTTVSSNQCITNGWIDTRGKW